MNGSEEVASHCDDCYGPIMYHNSAWMVTRYIDEDGNKVVEIICQACYGVEIPEGQKTIKVVLE